MADDWSEAKAWMRATRERIGMTQHDVAVLADLTVDMVKKYESEKYRLQPSEKMRAMLGHHLAEHRRAVAAIVERHRGEERAVLSFSRVSDLSEGLPDWVRAEESVKRRAAVVREAAVLLEAEGVAVAYIYLPDETK
ncbi:XRE family transcriptional regulator [Bifidobacterium dentium]|uniref:XRE family transcriptional regulator n=1 Tax=Bifidobacterium dentium TaxID=1689 RepID=UPI0018B0CDE3|nr:XRE family transcriptional regulator [Bifidobacterium dentium]MBF9669618.1 XRE family transcriptional regulator [Bifidobacterium dentium]